MPFVKSSILLRGIWHAILVYCRYASKGGHVSLTGGRFKVWLVRLAGQCKMKAVSDTSSLAFNIAIHQSVFHLTLLRFYISLMLETFGCINTLEQWKTFTANYAFFWHKSTTRTCETTECIQYIY